MRICVRSKDAQKQLARTSLNTTEAKTSDIWMTHAQDCDVKKDGLEDVFKMCRTVFKKSLVTNDSLLSLSQPITVNLHLLEIRRFAICNFTITAQIVASISGQTQEFIIYAMRQRARADNKLFSYRKKTNGRQLFMRLSCYRQSSCGSTRR